MMANQSLILLDWFLSVSALPLLGFYIWFGLDDTILDFYAWVRGLHAGNISILDLRRLRRKKQKRIAVIVAAWKEHDVIARMVRGNHRQIDYSNYHFFVGVYPNDFETLQAIHSLKSEVNRLSVVVNTENGPTSKGQMLNQVVRAVLAREKRKGQPEFDIILIHDSEDIIHPYALLTLNSAMDQYEFVQVPVLSLSVQPQQWVAGIYMDEFAEVHMKDLRVRNELTGCFPAAGVGMALSRRLVDSYLKHQSDQLFNEKSLTEDYELGLTAAQIGGRCQFICAHIQHPDGKKEILATREYFPKKVRRSIKQKARWTVGIAFQGWERLGWRRGFWQNFFLYRDRKGPIANAVVFVGTMLWGYAVLRWAYSGVELFERHELVLNGFFITLAMMGNRMFQKIYACTMVYGWIAALGAPIRTIGANLINFLASLLAVKQYVKSKLSGATLKWSKTEHELPGSFGEGESDGKSKSHALAQWIGFILFLQLIVNSAPAHAFSERNSQFECVRVYYDATRDPQYTLSRYYAIFLENLLGHFPEFQTIVEPIENYQAGDMEECRASFYLGSHYDAQIPQAFFDDSVKTKQVVVWLGYSIWRFDPEKLQSSFGIRYSGYLTSLDWQRRDERNRPTFYRDILYKGEKFQKYGEYASSESTSFNAAFEMTAVEPNHSETQVLAQAQHNGTGDKLPYATRKQNHFYIADIPFIFMNESDRYSVFADLLFDILEVEPKRKDLKLAILRLEDVHPRIPVYQINAIAEVAKRQKIPLNIALIPIFSDPLFEMDRAPGEDYIPMHTDRRFLKVIKEVAKQKSSFIWHGVTHQYGNIRNPYNGASGDDFEFWDINQNTPVPEDGVDWALNRLNDGWSTISKSGLKPKVWEVPHYLASVLDYAIFSRTFSWTIGRVAYRPAQFEGVPPYDSNLLFENTGLDGDRRRKSAFASLRAAETAPPLGQFFPYEIYGDNYGQRVLPENLGHPQVPYDDSGVELRTIDRILKDAKRNLVLRDIWASVFVHPELVTTKDKGGMGRFPGDAVEIERMVKELKKMGYKFISVDEFIADKKTTLRPPTIRIPLRQSQASTRPSTM